jgi:hypothetical protein
LQPWLVRTGGILLLLLQGCNHFAGINHGVPRVE